MRLAWRCVFFTAFAWLVGCKTQPVAPGVEDDYRGSPMTCVDHDGDGYGFGCALGLDCDDSDATVTNQCRVCAHDQPGCPCHADGTRSACGKVTARLGDQTTCGYGTSVCWNGTWGECTLDGSSTRSFTSTSAHDLGLAAATSCETICDPYCKQYADTPDDSLTTHTGIVGTDGGLTLALVEGGATSSPNPNGPMPDRIKNQLTDAGLYPDAAPDALIYHELVSTATAEDTVAAATNVKAIDVYFVDYTKGVRGTAQRDLWFKLDDTGAAMDAVRSHVPDSWFGAGRYDQYNASPTWNTTPYQTVVYEHMVSMTSVLGNVSGGIDWIDRLFNSTGYAPTSWADALFAMATTGGLRRDVGNWVEPRSTWSTSVDTLTEGGACPLGRMGYPCFRPWALPVTVLFAQSPSNNGPGGQYAYSRNATYGIGGAAQWPATSIAVTGNYTEATAQALDPVAPFATYTGSTTGAMANQSWHFGAFDGCSVGEFAAERNVFFKFHATGPTWFHFDTVGSSFDTALYMYGTSGTPVGCNDRQFSGSTPTPMPASLDGWVDAGDYYVVVDGKNGMSGNYTLHVNAMPDGAASGPVAEPSYDEAVVAMNRIGAKVVSVDSSNYTCPHGAGASIQRNTGHQLEKLGIDTGSVDATGAAYRVVIDPDNGPCHTGDIAIATQVGNAINGLFDGVANGRMDVSGVAVDVDDAIDFDGPPGRANPLTPINIDDATFVESITPVPTPETNARCLQAMADRFVGCLPGTNVTFHVTFRIPPTVPLLPHEQIFSFVIRTVRAGTLVLGERPVVIVVPPSSLQYADAWFVRDYDTTDACPKGTAPLWGFFTWTSHTPSGSHIDFEVAVASSVAELSSSPFDALLFTDPPGPSGLVDQPVGAAQNNGDYNTEAGGALVDSTLQRNMRARDSKALRLRAHLVPSLNGAVPPVLELWTQTISCQPAE